MPDMNGLETTRRIRELASDIRAAATVPIIALTVNAFRETVQESIDAGMNEHIVKPIDPDTFYQILMKYLK